MHMCRRPPCCGEHLITLIYPLLCRRLHGVPCQATQFEVTPRYWSQNNPPYEVDFLIQRENDIFPVEVKSEANISSKSLKKFKELFPDKVKLRVRFSLDNLKLDDDVLNIPLFMADQTDRLIGLALEQLRK